MKKRLDERLKKENLASKNDTDDFIKITFWLKKLRKLRKISNKVSEVRITVMHMNLLLIMKVLILVMLSTFTNIWSKNIV